MMKKSKLVYLACLQTLGVWVYVSGVAWIMFNGERLFGQGKSFWIPVMMLLLFVFSAAVTGSLVFGRSIHLYMTGAKKEGVQLLVYTLVSLFTAVILTFALLIFFNRS